ncbi:hypothetical protein BV898_01793 [Hypsibius exemplaris]|uniref:Uncharacterized protein n=1 Tax=Hypsibius exemplaris TaxID=2072580 RepID=A0A1W0X9T4_HYPEX|nr:hypothetical protein BV898_01793 [Hypsibius exemplaris]
MKPWNDHLTVMAAIPLLIQQPRMEKTELAKRIEEMVWPYPPAQREWVARYAPRLPDICHKWVSEGLFKTRWLVFELLGVLLLVGDLI